MAEGLLNGLKVNEFKRDFLEIIRAGFGLDDEYSKDMDISKKITEVKKIINAFNRKYTGLWLKLVKTLEDIKIKIFIKEDSPKTVFEAASKLPGLKSIGTNGFNEADVASPKFAKVFEKVNKKLFLSYQKGSLYLEGKNKIEVHYDFESITNTNLPEFNLCAYYALKDGHKKVNLIDKLSSLGFSSWLNKEENRAWTEKFNPPYEE